MLRATKTGLIAVAMTASTLTLTAGPAEAAADYQQRTGHYRPAVRPKVYRVNDEGDADNDGTACEVTR